MLFDHAKVKTQILHSISLVSKHFLLNLIFIHESNKKTQNSKLTVSETQFIAANGAPVTRRPAQSWQANHARLRKTTSNYIP